MLLILLFLITTQTFNKHKFQNNDYSGTYMVTQTCSSMSCDRSEIYFNNKNYSINCPLSGQNTLTIENNGY